LPNVDGTFHNNGLSGLTEVIHNGLSQTLIIFEGWNGVSTYLEPLNSDVSNMFDPVINDVVMLYNTQGVFWPGQNLNTLGHWNEHSGYIAKFTNDAMLTISGNELSDLSVNLNQGWNIIPVLSQDPFNVEMLFSSLPGFVVAKEIAGMGVYLPGYGINTICNVTPGNAYFALTNEAGSISYFSPEVNAGTGTILPKVAEISSPWNSVEYNPESHVVVFNLKDKPFMTGDVIGAFTDTDWCAGQVVVNDEGSFALTVNGDDSYEDGITGFAHGEALSYKLYRPGTDETIDLEVSYNSSMTPGIFTSNGLSEVVEVKASATGVSDVDEQDIRIYPNPSSGIFNIKGIEGQVEMKVIDIFGKIVLTGTLDKLQVIDLGGKPKGVYFLKIKTGDGFESTRKLILQ